MRGKRKRPRVASPSTAEHEPVSRPGEKAIEAFQEADNLDSIPRLSHGDEVVYTAEAERLRQEGHALLHPDRPVVAGAVTRSYAASSTRSLSASRGNNLSGPRRGSILC